MSDLFLRMMTIVSGISLFLSTRAVLIERRTAALHGYGAMDFSQRGGERFRITGSVLMTLASILLLTACVLAQLLHIAIF